MKKIEMGGDMQDLISNDVVKELEARNMQDGEEFMVLHTVAIVGVLRQGKFVVQELIPHVV